MVLDVIDNNYLASHKYSYIWKWFLIIVLIVYLLDSFNIIKLSETQDTIFSFVVILVMLALLVNQFLFTRIGKLELIENIIITRINDSIQTIELDAIKTVKVSNTNKNQYYL